MARICVWMLRISFKGFNFAFQCFEFGSNGSNLHLNASIEWFEFSLEIGMVRIACDRFKFAFELLVTGSNLHSNALNFVRMIPICIRMVGISFQWLEYAFECFESRSKGLNLHSNASNLVRMVRICIWSCVKWGSTNTSWHINAHHVK